MKPWEETWRVRNSVGCTDDVYCDSLNDYVLRGNLAAGEPGSEDADRRAKLAAAAPEMARLLMEIQWLGQVGGYEPEFGCPVCFAEEPSEQTVPARRMDAWTRTEATIIKRGGHAPDCRLVAVLRKAGVME